MSASRPDFAAPSALRPRAFLGTLLQLALLVYVMRAFHLEERIGFQDLLPVLLGGFVIHAWLPAPWKLPGFLAVSLVGAVCVLGPMAAALVLVFALALFGICHLPIGLPWRAALLAAAGSAMAALLLGVVETSWARVVMPVVASMFMFRAIVYLYDTNAERKTGKAPAPLPMRLAHFFLLPNVCFLLFPVVDYRTFERTYYDDDPHRIHQRGLQWMLRGVVHLLLYRAVYAYLTPVVPEVQDLAGVLLFAVSSYMLYLRISGHFHLIVGMLHLFGFHLPRTNHNYLFASSFTDTWRRINVYWMEFMKKVVYFPVFARARKHGLAQGMIAATAATFAATWLLHAYQWFWLHGAWPQATDGVFWGVAGVLAMVNGLLEARGGSAGLAIGRPSFGAALRRTLQAIGIFALICSTWSLWCSASVADWLHTLSQARHATTTQVLALAAGLGIVLIVGTLGQRGSATDGAARMLSAARGPVATFGFALGLAVIGQPALQEAAGDRVVAAMAPIQRDLLNERDKKRLVASYYDRLIDREGFGGRVHEGQRVDPDDPEVFLESKVAAETEGPLRWELPPSKKETFQEAVVETNEHGMRDRDYSVEKPDGTYRIAILGACYEMGAGVSNAQVWEAIAEEQLNRELSPKTGKAYEILNFSVAGYDLMQLVTVVREKVPPFEPDLVVVSNHVRSSVDFVLKRTSDESEWPEGLAEMVAETRLKKGVQWEARLEDWAFVEIRKTCESFGGTPALLNVPVVEALLGLMTEGLVARVEDQARRARELGLEYLDLGAAFDGQQLEDIAIPEMRRAPSPNGHRLLAEEFCRQLNAQAKGLGAL